MIESWKQSVLGAIVIAVAILVGVGLQSWSLADIATKQPPVVMWEKSGSPISFSTPEAALAYASSLRGFTVVAPGYLPSGYVLTEVDLSAKPAPPIQEHPTAFFTIRRGSAVLRMTVTYSGFNVDYSGAIIARPSVDSSVVKGARRNDVSYLLITPTQVIDLTTGAANHLTDSEAVRILGSVPRNPVNREWR